MENERDNTYNSGEGSDPGLDRTGGRQSGEEPVVVAEQPACPVDSRPDGSSSGADGWNQPSSSQQDTWNSAGYTSAQGSSWGTAGGQGTGQSQPGGQYQGSGQSQNSGQYQGGGQSQSGSQSQGTGQSQPAGQGSSQPVYKTAPPSYSGQSQSGSQYQNPYESRSGNQYQSPYQSQPQYQTQYQKPAEENNSMATSSLVMGILSLVSCCCSWLGIVFGVLGIIFAIISKGDGTMSSRAKTGLILSGVGVAFNILLIILAVGLQLFALLPEFLS